ncbi:MAG: hypothetical protein RLZZ618_1209 [Pseudomonadota bacterium]|jgi:penicillin-insensitive murein endopeptidase
MQHLRPMRAALAASVLLACGAAATAADSTCYGRPGQGRLEDGVALPGNGVNFSAYSSLAAGLGRTYVHSTVRNVAVEAYAALATALPGTVFVYGETGREHGGPMRPHRTHQNGLSIDFMVPVRDGAGRSVPLPTLASQKFGYALEFDSQGRLGDLRIDFEAVGAHLVALDRAARARKAGLALVIFDPRYLPTLMATSHGPYLQARLKFMHGPAWVRHDEHYHVDFAVPCLSLSASPAAKR